MIILSGLFFIIGLALLLGGGWLIALGGSLYYCSAGIAFIAVSLLLRKQNALANLLYAIFLIATITWAYIESGLSWWPLATRMGLFLILAIPLLLVSFFKYRRGWVFFITRLGRDRYYYPFSFIHGIAVNHTRPITTFC